MTVERKYGNEQVHKKAITFVLTVNTEHNYFDVKVSAAKIPVRSGIKPRDTKEQTTAKREVKQYTSLINHYFGYSTGKKWDWNCAEAKEYYDVFNSTCIKQAHPTNHTQWKADIPTKSSCARPLDRPIDGTNLLQFHPQPLNQDTDFDEIFDIFGPLGEFAVDGGKRVPLEQILAGARNHLSHMTPGTDDHRAAIEEVGLLENDQRLLIGGGGGGGAVSKVREHAQPTALHLGTSADSDDRAPAASNSIVLYDNGVFAESTTNDAKPHLTLEIKPRLNEFDEFDELVWLSETNSGNCDSPNVAPSNRQTAVSTITRGLLEDKDPCEKTHACLDVSECWKKGIFWCDGGSNRYSLSNSLLPGNNAALPRLAVGYYHRNDVFLGATEPEQFDFEAKTNLARWWGGSWNITQQPSANRRKMVLTVISVGLRLKHNGIPPLMWLVVLSFVKHDVALE